MIGVLNDKENGEKHKLCGRDSKAQVSRSKNELVLGPDEKDVSAPEDQEAGRLRVGTESGEVLGLIVWIRKSGAQILL